MHPRAAELIRRLDLAPHPEGGYFREIFRSDVRVSLADGRSPRSALTTIFFLLVEGQVSRWHAVASDEVWHLYEGGPLDLFVLSAEKPAPARIRLASVAAGTQPTHTVPAHHWQAARPAGAYALAGCTVGPGFAFEDFRFLADDPAMFAALRASAADLLSLV
jgi:uncharacterized protein